MCGVTNDIFVKTNFSAGGHILYMTFGNSAERRRGGWG